MLFSPILNDDITLFGSFIRCFYNRETCQVFVPRSPGIYHFSYCLINRSYCLSFSVIRHLPIIMLTTHDTNLYEKKHICLQCSRLRLHAFLSLLCSIFCLPRTFQSVGFSIFWTYLISDVFILLLTVKIYKHRKSPRNVWYI